MLREMTGRTGLPTQPEALGSADWVPASGSLPLDSEFASLLERAMLTMPARRLGPAAVRAYLEAVSSSAGRAAGSAAALPTRTSAD
jgi:hypothetical protein